MGLKAHSIRMFQEIREQPEILENIWTHRSGIGSIIPSFSNISLVLFIAFGSSYNAALFGQLLFYHYLGIPALVATPGFFMMPKSRARLKNALVIAISQSGEVEDVIQGVEHLKRIGGRTLAVTNNPDSRLARLCQEVLPLYAGPEKSVPATKTFTATLFTLQLLGAFWGAKGLLKSLPKVPDYSEDMLRESHRMETLSKKIFSASRGFILSSESLKPVSSEGSLKFNECAQIMLEPFEWREFFHGPISLADKETPILLLRGTKRFGLFADLERTVKKTRAPVYPVKLPVSFQSEDVGLSAIPYTIALQLLSFYAACRKGINPDRPRFLHKVTQAPVALS